jgi:serine/threonine-protein kinase RsbW
MGMAGSNRRSKPANVQRPAAKKAASRPDGTLRFVIGSDFAAGRKVQKRIIDTVTRLGYGAQCIFAIKLALEEALINAIKHGNRFDPHKNVRIEAKITPAQAEIIIEDEGPGFCRTGVPDPTLEENLEKCSGRGILLIEAYMTRVRYAKGGRRVRMIKKNEPEACR